MNRARVKRARREAARAERLGGTTWQRAMREYQRNDAFRRVVIARVTAPKPEGGTLVRGQRYQVGEQGEERFVPDRRP